MNFCFEKKQEKQRFFLLLGKMTQMDVREGLFYGLGLIAYAVAKADGVVQVSEKKELHELISTWSEDLEVNFDVTEIVFSIVNKQNQSSEQGYELGMKYIERGKEFLTVRLEELFIYLIQDVSRAFHKASIQENELVTRFSNDLAALRA